MFLAHRLNLEAHGLQVAFGIDSLIAPDVQQHHRSGPPTDPQADRVGGLNLGTARRILGEDGVLRKVGVGLVVHLNAEASIAQTGSGLIQRLTDQRGHFDQFDPHLGRLIAATYPERVDELQHQVAEGHQQADQHHRKHGRTAQPIVATVAGGRPKVPGRHRDRGDWTDW